MRAWALPLLAACGGPGGPGAGAVDSGSAPADTAAAPATAPVRFSGQEVYLARCVYCHGGDARGTADGPDLRPALESRPSADLVPVVRAGVGQMPPQDLTAPEAWRALEHARGLAGLR